MANRPFVQPVHHSIADICRYNINGFVEELPRLLGGRYYHSCAALPSNGVRLNLDQPLKPFQAFVVAGGFDGSNRFSSVATLLPGAPAWTFLASLPRPVHGARASLHKGKMRLSGGYFGSNTYSSQVTILCISKHVLTIFHKLPK